MAKEKRLKGPYWTRNWIDAMWRFTNENFVDFDSGAVDYEALGREEFQFRKALFFRNFKNSERAKVAFDTADEDYKRPVENGKKGGRPKKLNDQETAQASTNAGEASSREAEEESATFSGADFTARQGRQVSATADALVHQTRAGAGAQALESPSSLPSPVRNLPRNKEEVRLFAIDNGLDVDDANDWAEMNLRERHGRDKDGKPIRNWKGAILNYCKAMAAKRETA